MLYIGIGGAACSLLYPPLKYRALGDVVIFLAYALLPTLGTCYVATGVVDWNVLWIALPVGLITVAILHANNTRDMRTDARAEIQTLAMKLGGKASMYVYCAEVLFPFGWIAGLIAAGTLPLWTLLVMPALAVPISLAFGMPAIMLRANVLESAMPTMISAAALAMAHGLAPRLAAALVGYGIVLCLATLPAWAWLLARIV